MAWRGGARQARGKGGISNGGWGQGEEGRVGTNGDLIRLGCETAHGTPTDGLRLVLRRDELRERERESESCSSSGGYYATQ